ncbi:hypothetical protein Q2941_04725 [Bradyrhizobium sp. UFLA05-153]
MTTMMYSENDYRALTLSMQYARRQSQERSDQIDYKLEHEPWESVAKFAAFSAQIRSLKLKAWQWPPCAVIALEHPEASERIAARVLKKMLRHGISRWHPDPEAALAAVVGAQR